MPLKYIRVDIKEIQANLIVNRACFVINIDRLGSPLNANQRPPTTHDVSEMKNAMRVVAV